MTVHAIPFEHLRYFVESQSGREPHVVDLDYKPEPWSKSRPACGCECYMAQNKPVCPHIIAAAQWELNRIHHENHPPTHP